MFDVQCIIEKCMKKCMSRSGEFESQSNANEQKRTLKGTCACICNVEIYVFASFLNRYTLSFKTNLN